MMSLRSICKEAIAAFGAKNQIKKCIEELGELSVALAHYEDGKDTLDHVAEEIADMEIMLQQMQLLFRCQSVVEAHRVNKMHRLREKIAKAKVEGCNNG